MASLNVNPKFYDESFAHQHAAALTAPKAFEQPILASLIAWKTYAESHKQRYESPIGEDGVIGEFWKDWGLALRGLLNGETGRLDCETLDAFILDTLRENGFSEKELGL